jgi:hypothetical protein
MIDGVKSTVAGLCPHVVLYVLPQLVLSQVVLYSFAEILAGDRDRGKYSRRLGSSWVTG